MSTSTDGPSLRNKTGAIRRLDAARARELVAGFSRPVVAAEKGIAAAATDPVAKRREAEQWCDRFDANTRKWLKSTIAACDAFGVLGG